MSNPIDDFEAARDEYLESKEREYSFEKNGRFGRLISTGEVVEIVSYTEPDENERQELFFKNIDESLLFAYADEFDLFDIHSSFLNDNPLKFGDMVQMKDIPTSEFLNLEEKIQEDYDLYFGKIGLITQVIEEKQEVLIAFKREVISFPIYLIDKIYEREIW